MLFFQMLCCWGIAGQRGYPSARGSTSWRYGGLALISVIFSRLDWVAQSGWTGLGGILLSLTLATLPAMVLLFSIGPLMHGWLRRQGQGVPTTFMRSPCRGLQRYCSILTIERVIQLSDQIQLWRGLLCVLAGAIGVAGMCYMRSEDAIPLEKETIEPIPLRLVAKWIGLSALTCVGMLGATIILQPKSARLAHLVGPFGVSS